MTTTVEVLACPLATSSVSFRIVDEHGDGSPYTGLSYRLTDSQSRVYEGSLDCDGFAEIKGISHGATLLDLSAAATTYPDPWYEELKIRKWINRQSANTDVSITVLLVNALIFIVIVTLREDPLPTGM